MASSLAARATDNEDDEAVEEYEDSLGEDPEQDPQSGGCGGATNARAPHSDMRLPWNPQNDGSAPRIASGAMKAKPEVELLGFTQRVLKKRPGGAVYGGGGGGDGAGFLGQ